MDYPTVEKLREEITELKLSDTEQKIKLLNIDDKLEALKEDNQEIKERLDTFISKMENGYIPKRVKETIYQSTGKWVIGFLLANIATILGLMMALLGKK